MPRKKSSIPPEYAGLVGARKFGRIFKPKFKDRKTGETRESSFWFIRYSCPECRKGGAHPGKKHLVRTRSTKVEDAEQTRWKIFGELFAGQLPWIKKDPVSLLALLDMVSGHYTRNKRKSEDRMLRSRKHVLSFPGFLEGALPHTKAATKLEEYVEFRQKADAANGTINRELALIRMAYRLGRKRHDEEGVPLVKLVPSVDMLQEASPKEGFFEHHEFEAVRAEILKLTHGGEAIADLATFYYLTGWRRDEVVSLRWDQVNWFRKTITLRRDSTKAGEPWELPFGDFPRLEDLLRRRLKRTEEAQRKSGAQVANVFHRDGRPVVYFRDTWNMACANAKVKRTPHDFRRTAARNWIDAGVDPLLACELVGWKTTAMLKRYRITRLKDRESAVSKLAELHESQRSAHQMALSFEEGKKRREG